MRSSSQARVAQLGILILPLFASCATGEGASSECDKDADCGEGLACLGGQCRAGTTDGGPGGSAGAESGVDASPDSDASAGTAGASGGGPPVDASGDPVVEDSSPTAAPDVPAVRFPWNGYQTGSALAPSAGLARAPRRPTFSWDPQPDASRYELELDASCDPADVQACPFSSAITETAKAPPLTVGELGVPQAPPPVGLRYYWRVRACNMLGCSGWTSVRYLDVGRQRSDFNGDGYADLAVAASEQSNPEAGEGEVYVYYGASGGVPTTPSLVIGSQDDEAGSRFGAGLAAVGDVNADGFADLAVGASSHDGPGAEVDVGRVYVFLGSASGLATSASVVLDDPVPEPAASFGWEVARAGDVDGDGFADVLVGAPAQDDGTSPDAGTAFLFRGSALGVAVTPAATLTGPSAQSGADFGRALGGVGDFDGDGFPDVAVGAPGSGTGDQGAVFLYRGGASGLGPTPHRRLDNPENEPGALFGATVSGGDVDGDGFADVAIAAPRQDASVVDGGKIWVFLGSRTGIGASWDEMLASPKAVAGDFGASITSARDVDADGVDDLVVGAPTEPVGSAQGVVYLYRGTPSGLPAVPDATLDNPNPVDSLAQFGASVGVADVSGDGHGDVVVGAPTATVAIGSEGRAFVFDGAGVPTGAAPAATLDNPLPMAGRFGHRVTGR